MITFFWMAGPGAKKSAFFARAPTIKKVFASAASARAREKMAFFMHVHAFFLKKMTPHNPTPTDSKDQASAHTSSLAHSSPCMGMQQGGPRRTGRQSPGYHFRSPGPPTARVLRDIRPKCKVRLYATCPRRARPATPARQLRAFASAASRREPEKMLILCMHTTCFQSISTT